ncbi:MAG TPA: TlpA disulfide reductase family protein [Gemmatimonadales bacterium]|jgi:thiol-disulfide isomerase/thioredoxin|nr:TlpA disulfide reductase family protein [Gemmatimonadales bacterium]
MVNRKGVGRGAWGVLLAVLLPSLAVAQDDVVGIPVGQTPPAVTIQDLDGNSVDLGRWVGKTPVIVEFWATWCPICAELLPRMEAAHKKYGDRVEFLVVAVAVNESPNTVRRHLDRHPMPFTFLWDVNGNATRAFQAPSTSYVAVLDSKGKVVYTGTGADQDIEEALQRAVADGKRR